MRVAVTDRKRQILEEASRLFSLQGYDKVTIKQLAAACGITEPALYRHYPSKEAIYDAVLDSIGTRLDYEGLFKRLEKEDDLETLLFSLAHHIIDFFTAHADLYRHLLFSALGGHEKAKAVYDIIRGAYVRFLVKQLNKLYKQKKIIKKRNDITARCFIGMVFDCSLGKTLWKGFQGKEYKPSEVVANNVPIYVRGLKA